MANENGWPGRLIDSFGDSAHMVVERDLAGPRGVCAAAGQIERCDIVAAIAKRIEHPLQHQAPWTPPWTRTNELKPTREP